MIAPQKKRIEYIDALRGFTMLLVVMCHIEWAFGGGDYGYNGFMEVFRMPLFFFISGWVFYKADRLWSISLVKSILQKKFVIQIIPTAIFLLLYLYIFKSITIDRFGSDKTGYWFTFVLFEYFVVYILAERLLNKRNLAKGEIWVGVVMAQISILSFYYGECYTYYAAKVGSWKDVLALFSFLKFRHLIFFWAGTIVRRFFSDFIKFTDNRYVMPCMILLFFVTILRPHACSVLGQYFVYVMLGFAGICVVFTFFRTHESNFSSNRTLGRVLQFVGRRTLDIYLLHYFFLPYNLKIIENFLRQYGNKTIGVLVMLPLSVWVITICLLVSEIIRLSPLLEHYLFGGQKKRN